MPPKPPPRLSVAETVYRYGRVPQGTPVEHTFPVTNDGGVPLTIMQLRTACDTTAAVVGGDEVPPGGHGAIRVRFETGATHGAQRRTVTVYSNDPERRTVLLSLEGEVALGVAAEPAKVHLGTVAPGTPGLREVALLSGDGARFAAPTTPTGPLQVVVRDGPDAARLTIGTAPDAPPGPFLVTLRIPTTSATRPVVEVEVGGVIAAAAATPGPTP